MKTKITNQITMLKTSGAYMADHSAVWNSMTRLQTAMTEVNAKVAEIDEVVQQYGTPSGAAADKADARDDLEEATFLMCEALGVVAHDEGNNELVALTKVTRTGLDRMDGEELSSKASAVLGQAHAHLTQLATVQVTQATIDDMSEALTNFNQVKTAPRTATAERAVLTEKLPRLVREAMDIYDHRIDRMVNLFSTTDPDFVAGYKNARAIVDRPATHKTKPAPAPAPVVTS
jgi:hypothetical protein